LKDTWEWELDEAHWKEIKNAFPSVASMWSSTRDERYFALDQLDPKERLSIDEFARSRITNEHPEWMEEELAKAQLRPMSLKIRLKGGKVPLDGISNPQTLADLLNAGDLSSFSEDGKNYYRFVNKEKPSEKKLAPLGDVLKDPTFDEIVAKRNYGDLLKAIEKDYIQAGRALPEETSMDFFASRRLFHFMKTQSHELAMGSGAQGLWPLEKKELEIKRQDRGFFDPEELFTKTVGDWSGVTVKDQGAMGFFRLVDRKQGQVPYEDEMDRDREALIAQAKKKMVRDLLPVLEQRVQQRKTNT
jgi:hypothetical protein